MMWIPPTPNILHGDMMAPSLKVMEVVANGDPYLFEHMIQADGLEIVGVVNDDPLETRVQSESIDAIASMLTEDVYNPHELTPRQRALKNMAEARGYVVALQEGMDQQPGTEYDPIKGQLQHPEKKQAPPPTQEGAEEGAAPPQQ